MKHVKLSDDAFATLQRLAAAKKLEPSVVLAALLSDGKPLSGDHLLFYVASAEFAALPDDTERYLGLLAWIAANYASDFDDFISHQDSARRYLMIGRERLNHIRLHNQARQIDGTHFWAVMNIDRGTKARFVRRLLEFVGCHDETVAFAVKSVGLGGDVSPGFRLLAS